MAEDKAAADAAAAEEAYRYGDATARTSQIEKHSSNQSVGTKTTNSGNYGGSGSPSLTQSALQNKQLLSAATGALLTGALITDQMSAQDDADTLY